VSAPDTPRPSHDALMAAQEALGNARNIEQAAGNNLVAELLNQLTLAVFKVALQDDLDEWLAAQRSGAR
jgi:hypothetical protein